MTRALVPAALLALTLWGCPTAPPLMPATSPSPSASASATTTMHPSIDPNASPATGVAGKVYHVATDAPPYLLPPDTLDRVHAAGIVEKPSESLNYHVHAHLDVFYNGQAVTVPGLIGIQESPLAFSPLHSHSTDGVIHIEAPQKTDFLLSQYLTEWGVSPDGFTGYVNGVKQDDAGKIVLRDQIEIVLTYGTAPNPIPFVYPLTAPGPGTGG